MKTLLYSRLVPRRGFTLVIAVIFVSVFLGFGIALGTLGYKQAILASSAVDSQHAFYAAEAALECALYMDRQFSDDPSVNPFLWDNRNMSDGALPPFKCGVGFQYPGYNFGTRCKGTGWCTNQYHVSYWRIPIAFADPVTMTALTETRCADITVYSPNPGASLQTYIFSQGYNVDCAQVTSATSPAERISARGIQVSY